MILVGQFDSPYVRRVAIGAHLLGLPFERNTLSAFADAEAMRRINPLGRIPSLVLDDGEVLVDSAAILDYLDDISPPERRLLPATGVARRRALQITTIATGVTDKTGGVIYERGLRPADKVYQPWIDRCRTQLDGGLAALEARTGDGWYLDRPGLPDITVGCILAFLRMRLPEAFPPGGYPRLERLSTALDALPAFVQTRPAPDEVMPAGI